MPRTRGRQPDPSSKSSKIRELLKTGMSPVEIAKKVGCTPALVYNVKGRAGGPRKMAARRSPAFTVEGNGLASVLAAMQGAERQHAAMRAALEKITQVIEDVLARP